MLVKFGQKNSLYPSSGLDTDLRYQGCGMKQWFQCGLNSRTLPIWFGHCGRSKCWFNTGEPGFDNFRNFSGVFQNFRTLLQTVPKLWNQKPKQNFVRPWRQNTTDRNETQKRSDVRKLKNHVTSDSYWTECVYTVYTVCVVYVVSSRWWGRRSSSTGSRRRTGSRRPSWSIPRTWRSWANRGSWSSTDRTGQASTFRAAVSSSATRGTQAKVGWEWRRWFRPSWTWGRWWRRGRRTRAGRAGWANCTGRPGSCSRVATRRRRSSAKWRRKSTPPSKSTPQCSKRRQK